MSTTSTIVIAGGYGLVGRLIAERLAPQFSVVLAGRDPDRARAAAASIGHGVRAERLDASDPESVQALLRSTRPTLVVACAPKSERALAQGCLAAGVDYTDVSADFAGIAQADDLHELAVQTGATAVLSVGIAPGLTNLLARDACSLLDEVHRLDLGVRLHIADEHGAAAIEWTLENLAVPFDVVENGAIRSERPFIARRSLDFGGHSRVPGGGFNFPEQRTLARTLDIPTVRSWLAIEPAILHGAAVAAARSGTARILGSKSVRRPLVRAMGSLPQRQGGFAVCAEATGLRNGRRLVVAGHFAGHGEAAMTAEVAAHVARRLTKKDQPHGVWHIEQLPDSGDLLTALASEAGSQARVTANTASASSGRHTIRSGSDTSDWL
ncbi:MAG: saccharopine dehydrogenase NADP-binding domain-containing protein [Mycobacterium sp.]